MEGGEGGVYEGTDSTGPDNEYIHNRMLSRFKSGFLELFPYEIEVLISYYYLFLDWKGTDLLLDILLRARMHTKNATTVYGKVRSESG